MVTCFARMRKKERASVRASVRPCEFWVLKFQTGFAIPPLQTSSHLRQGKMATRHPGPLLRPQLSLNSFLRFLRGQEHLQNTPMTCPPI
jgi:hypothetical protein